MRPTGLWTRKRWPDVDRRFLNCLAVAAQVTFLRCRMKPKPAIKARDLEARPGSTMLQGYNLSVFLQMAGFVFPIPNIISFLRTI